ncbi:Hypothetical_protein [Hexamita inflata]|uniref:Hypothetical_protein n=1 Tax=Hexamita inflata TaxID=28002 RepID=A0AA86PM71_9EUKA|nr:Hypothetical protein HINF_LOCUS29672 [Hexamita inflata]CAI9942031.1 Hypothetical protein HINF_LOCUS29676 [Hexamita inflata]
MTNDRYGQQQSSKLIKVLILFLTTKHIINSLEQERNRLYFLCMLNHCLFIFFRESVEFQLRTPGKEVIVCMFRRRFCLYYRQSLDAITKLLKLSFQSRAVMTVKLVQLHQKLQYSAVKAVFYRQTKKGSKLYQSSVKL